MPQLYLILAVASLVLGNLKDLFSSIKVGDDAKKLIRWGLIGVILYTLWKIIAHNINKTNALADENGNLAIQLHEAIYSQAVNFSVWGLGNWHIGNGDESAILAISERIKDLTEVAKFYKDLYGIDLFVDIAKVLDPEELNTFKENVSKVSGGTSNSGIESVVSTKTPAKGSPVYCNASGMVNIRSADDSNKVLYQVNSQTTYYSVFGKGKGYVGDFVRERKITIAGVPYTAWEVDIPYEKQFGVGIIGINYGLNGLIVKEFAYIKA